MKFGTKLDLWIKRTGTPAARVAEACGVSDATVSRWRKNAEKTVPTLHDVAVVAKLMGVPIGWLADDAQEDLPSPDPLRDQVMQLVEDLGLQEAKRRLLGLAADPQPWRLAGSREGPAFHPGEEPSADRPGREDERPHTPNAPPRRK